MVWQSTVWILNWCWWQLAMEMQREEDAREVQLQLMMVSGMALIFRAAKSKRNKQGQKLKSK